MKPKTCKIGMIPNNYATLCNSLQYAVSYKLVPSFLLLTKMPIHLASKMVRAK